MTIGRMRVKTALAWVLAADLFAGVAALAGSVGLVGGGIQFPSHWLNDTPFSDYTAPGLILGLAVGGSALVAAAITLLSSRQAGALASAVAGAVMIGWIVGELALVGYVSWMQPAFVAYGLAMVTLAVLYRDATPSATDSPMRHWRHAV